MSSAASGNMKGFYRQRKNPIASFKTKSSSKSKKSSTPAATLGVDVTQPPALVSHGVTPDLKGLFPLFINNTFLCSLGFRNYSFLQKLPYWVSCLHFSRCRIFSFDKDGCSVENNIWGDVMFLYYHLMLVLKMPRREKSKLYTR